VSSPMLVGAEFAGRFSGGIGKGIMMEGRTELRREPSCFDLKRVSFSGQNANADLSTRLVEGGDDVQIKDERGAASWKTRERSWSNRSFSLFSFLFSLFSFLFSLFSFLFYLFSFLFSLFSFLFSLLSFYFLSSLVS
jgi:hypothetical protein